MLTDDEDRQFTVADIAELLAVVVALGLLFWLLEPLNPWLKYPAILFGSVAVLAVWRGLRRVIEKRSGGRAAKLEPLQIAETLVVAGWAMASVVNDPARLREVVAAAEADGFVFDD